MKKIEMTVEMKVPETLQECESLEDGRGNCFECAYNLKDILQPCQHRKVLEAIDKCRCWNVVDENKPSWNDMQKVLGGDARTPQH